MVVIEGKKLKRNRIWSANRGEVVCNTLSVLLYTYNLMSVKGIRTYNLEIIFKTKRILKTKHKKC